MERSFKKEVELKEEMIEKRKVQLETMMSQMMIHEKNKRTMSVDQPEILSKVMRESKRARNDSKKYKAIAKEGENSEKVAKKVQ